MPMSRNNPIEYRILSILEQCTHLTIEDAVSLLGVSSRHLEDAIQALVKDQLVRSETGTLSLTTTVKIQPDTEPTTNPWWLQAPTPLIGKAMTVNPPSIQPTESLISELPSNESAPVAIQPPKPKLWTRRAYEARENVSVFRKNRLPVMRPFAEIETEKEILIFDRPQTRRDCEHQARPCPFVSCKHHTYLDVDSEGKIHLNFPGVSVENLTHSCVLDIVNQEGEKTLEQVAQLSSVTRERIRQIEAKAFRRLKHREDLETLAEAVGLGEVSE